MIKVFFLIFEPALAWAKIAQARRGYTYIFTTYLLPFLLVISAIEGFGLAHWGKWQPKFQITKHFTLHEVLVFEAIEFALMLLVVLICSLLILRVSQTFHQRTKYLEAFTLTAYAFAPIFLLHFLDAASGINPWVPWIVGVALTIWILYQGIPRILEPDPTHAFGLYLSSMFVIALASGMARFITAMYLLGYMDFHQNSWLTRTLSHLFAH
ncbi:MAG TPA: Yip1 family protein [Verrucomicrobiae bacterium]|jgi:hypothetical protein